MKKLTRGAYAEPGTTISYKTGTWRTQRPIYTHRPAPCHAACPAGEDPQHWLAKLDEGNPRQAWESLVNANPLPAITGRVCPHPCESACNRGQYDQALAIHSVERYLGDLAIEHSWPYPAECPDPKARRVAIVGAGPAGLSCAWQLTRLGFHATVFDQLSQAGGTLHTIPGYRLPKDVVRNEIGRLLEAGIEFKPNHRIGKHIDVVDLQTDFDSVFLAPGMMQSREWNIDGVTPQDLHDGLNLLKVWMDIGELPEMKSAAVVGGGNTAIDIARVLRRCGVDTHIVIHSGMPGPDTPPEDAMRAIPREIEQALEEGVQIHDHHGIKRLILRGEKVTGIEMTRMRKLPDANGRLQRVAFEGTESILHVDQVIPAIGQRVDSRGMENLIKGRSAFKVDEWGLIEGSNRVHAGGDAIEGNSGTVTEAVGNGRIAAIAIAHKLSDQALPAPATGKPVEYSSLNVEYFEPSPRAEQPLLRVEQRAGEEEIEAGLEKSEAAHEAKRCLSCGSCMSCDNCWTLCPDSAVLMATDPAYTKSHYVFDYDYCKGCGLCAHECPTGFIRMQIEP